MVQGATVVTRGVSTAITAGIVIQLFSTGENIASLILSILAIVLVSLAAVMVLILLAMILNRMLKKSKTFLPPKFNLADGELPVHPYVEPERQELALFHLRSDIVP